MNRLGVALAADSAVTVSSGGSGKVFNSADKLFMLSRDHPVGVMVYENADILGIPWETVIKMFRAQLGSQSFDSLEDYGRELVAYLEHNEDLFPEELQQKSYLEAVENLFAELARRADERRDEGDLPELAKEEILAERDDWLSLPEASCLPPDVAVRLTSRFSGEIHRKIAEIFEKHGIDSEATTALYELARLLVSRDRIAKGSLSGIVVAGFGNKDVFPVLQHIEIGGVFEGKLKCKYREGRAISYKTRSHVQPFADCDVVQGFLHGISPMFHLEIVDQLAELIYKLPSEIVEAVDDLDESQKKRWKDRFNGQSRKAIARLLQDIDLYRKQQHFWPIRDAIATMPKEELGLAAARLISLNWFQKRMSLDSETVGGPIDVAVITKGDGFVWVDRKHYFKSELNPQYFARLRRLEED